MKDIAKKQAEKRTKDFTKKQKGEPLKMPNQNRNVLQLWRQKLRLSNQANLKMVSYDAIEASKKYSHLVGTVNSNNPATKSILNGELQENHGKYE